jgi:hypothetical protein
LRVSQHKGIQLSSIQRQTVISVSLLTARPFSIPA